MPVLTAGQEESLINTDMVLNKDNQSSALETIHIFFPPSCFLLSHCSLVLLKEKVILSCKHCV